MAAQILLAHDAALWIIAGAAACAILLFRPWRRRRAAASGRSTRADSTHRPPIAADLHALAKELSEMVRRATIQLDARSARLEKLLADADQRIERLRSLISQPSTARTSNVDDHAVSSTDPTADRLPWESPRLAHSDSEEGPTDEADPTAEQADARHAQIYAFQDRGLSPRQIADVLDRPTGEIELILALRPPDATPGSARV